jgi:transposase
MTQGTLIPNISEVALICLRPKNGVIQMVLRACRSFSVCPVCGTASGRIHSRYLRKLGDLPWEKLPVLILLQVRKFFCVEGSCRRTIFTEQLPGTVARYSRRTFRLSEALDWITLAVGGQAGARLARRLGLPGSGSTLLRQIRRRMRSAPTQAPRVLGIDDWAWRKGHRYGTILCDLETQKVIDLLPDRESETVAAWLGQHPGAEIVSRDRGGIYAEATRKAAPGAIQVADRWHLLRNMSEALKNALEPHHRLLAQAAGTVRDSEANAVPVPEAPSRTAPWELRMQQQNRQRRYSRYEEVQRLMQGGARPREIARHLGLDHRTVRKFMRAEFPEAKPRIRRCIVDPHAEYLDRRLEEGCRNITQLWRELREQGFGGQLNIVRRWLRHRRGYRPQPLPAVPRRAPLRVSPRQTVWHMLKATPSAQTYLDEVYRISPEVSLLAQLAREFFRMVRNRDLEAWLPWLASTKNTALAGFASRLVRDQDAVQAALRMPWSNGQVEGQVHRLKLIKRQMYGRASFDLLRLRVLQKV